MRVVALNNEQLIHFAATLPIRSEALGIDDSTTVMRIIDELLDRRSAMVRGEHGVVDAAARVKGRLDDANTDLNLAMRNIRDAFAENGPARHANAQAVATKELVRIVGNLAVTQAMFYDRTHMQGRYEEFTRAISEGTSVPMTLEGFAAMTARMAKALLRAEKLMGQMFLDGFHDEFRQEIILAELLEKSGL